MQRKQCEASQEKKVFLGNDYILRIIRFYFGLCNGGLLTFFDLKFDTMKLYLIETRLMTWLELIQ